MMIDADRAGDVFFSLENDHGDPMNYPLKARVTPGTLEIRGFDADELRSDLERILNKTRP